MEPRKIRAGAVVVCVQRLTERRLVFLYLGDDHWINFDGNFKFIPFSENVLFSINDCTFDTTLHE